MLRKSTIMLLLALPFSGIAVGQGIVFNVTGEFEVRAPTETIPSPDINGYDGASFEFDVVFEQGSEGFIFPPLFGDRVFQAPMPATLTITGAGDNNNGTFTSSDPVLFRPTSGDLGRSIGSNVFGPVRFGETEVALRSSSSDAVGRLLEPVGPPTPEFLAVDQFGNPEPSLIIFSDFANNFDPTLQSDYGVTNLVVSVTLLGDVNLSGTIDFSDLSPFLALLSSGGFQAEADINRNGTVDFSDISPFLAILSGS